MEPWRELRERQKINLYSMNRGINRFAGLAIMLRMANEKYVPIEDLTQYLDWSSGCRN
nr:hypothetical protein [uncultured Acetatifactor sp.]